MMLSDSFDTSDDVFWLVGSYVWWFMLELWDSSPYSLWDGMCWTSTGEYPNPLLKEMIYDAHICCIFWLQVLDYQLVYIQGKIAPGIMALVIR